MLVWNGNTLDASSTNLQPFWNSHSRKWQPQHPMQGSNALLFPFWQTLDFAKDFSAHWRRQWHPTPVLLPGKSHGWRSLVGCSPWGRYESDTTERLHFHFSLSCSGEGNGNPLQCSCLENPRDGGAWWAAVYGVAQSQTRLKWLSSSSSVILRPYTYTLSKHPNLMAVIQLKLLLRICSEVSGLDNWFF